MFTYPDLFYDRLSGPPGTGKTLTGESIADALRRPLYYVAASELGDSIQDIEKSLTKVFDLAARFHSIMLLDEADAFLEKRTDEMSPEATARNKVLHSSYTRSFYHLLTSK